MFSVNGPCCALLRLSTVHPLPWTVFSHILCDPFPQPPAGLEIIDTTSSVIYCLSCQHSTTCSLLSSLLSPDSSLTFLTTDPLSTCSAPPTFTSTLNWAACCSWTASVWWRVHEGFPYGDHRALSSPVSVWLSLGPLMMLVLYPVEQLSVLPIISRTVSIDQPTWCISNHRSLLWGAYSLARTLVHC